MISRVQVGSVVPEPDRAYLRSVRRGERSLAEVLDAITETETRLAQLCDSPATQPSQTAAGRRLAAPQRPGLLEQSGAGLASGGIDGQTGQRITSRPEPVP